MSGERRPVALVTGARRGIGRACAEALAAGGFDIAATDLEIDAMADEARGAIEAQGGAAVFFAHDLAAVETHRALVAAIVERFGRIDCLVNNAGRGAVVRADLLDLRAENFDAVMNVNLRGSVFFTQAVAKGMLAAGASERPRSIITITSVSAELVSPERTEYCVSKAGLSMAMKAFALRLAADNIGVFEVRPGIIRTDMTAGVAAKYEAAIADGLTPMRRWGETDDVASCVAALASGAFRFATGSIVQVDGGLSLPKL